MKMEYPKEVTRVGAAVILTSTISGVGVLALPRIAANAADTGAPLVTFIGVALAMISLYIVTILGMKFPRQTLIEYSEQIIGKWPARFGGVCVIVFFSMLTGLAAREFGEVIVTVVLSNTPIEIVVIVMLVLAALSSRHDMTTFSYMHLFYIPFILAPGAIIVIFSLKDATMLNLQPIWGNDPQHYLRGVLNMAALFQGSFIMTIIIPAMRKPAHALQSSFWGLGMAGGFYLMINIATVAVFGAQETKLLMWPTLELARATSLPANVLERLDAVFLIVWVTAVFTTLLSSYYLSSHVTSNLFRLKDHKMFAMFILPFIFFSAMFVSNVMQLYEWILQIGRWGLVITMVYPLLLLIVAWMRKKGSRRYANAKH